ncbi:MAG TPA: transglycosylase SLT domain-containing protein [Telluria sp.]|jgi:soluble lytic murein transglycosylase-like protein
MSHRSIGADATSGHTTAILPAARITSISSRNPRALFSNTRNTHHRLALLGVSSIALVALFTARPDLGNQPARTAATTQAAAVSAVAAPVQAPVAAPAPLPLPVTLTKAESVAVANHRQQQAVTTWLSKRYRVAGDAANMLVSTAYVTAKDIKLDPLLILAVMAIESGLNPFAESPVGAKGLMQVMAHIHHAKFQAMGGPQTALNPVANIRVGSQILKDYVTRGGSVEAGLKTYVGAAAFDTDAGYGSRVMAEYRKLKMVASGQKVPTFTKPVQVVAKTPAPRVESAPVPMTAPVVAAEESIAGL